MATARGVGRRDPHVAVIGRCAHRFLPDSVNDSGHVACRREREGPTIAVGMLRALLVLLLLPSAARAGTLVGKLELPSAPERPAAATKGFLERVENPLAPVQPLNVPKQIVIVVEGDEKPATPPQVSWDLLGNSFARPVIAAPAGAEVVIKNGSKTSHTLVAKEDPKLIPPGPINPTGPKSFRATDPARSTRSAIKTRRTSRASSSSSTRSSSRTPTTAASSRSPTSPPAPTR